MTKSTAVAVIGGQRARQTEPNTPVDAEDEAKRRSVLTQQAVLPLREYRQYTDDPTVGDAARPVRHASWEQVGARAGRRAAP